MNLALVLAAVTVGLVLVYLVVFRAPNKLTRNASATDIDRLKLQNDIRGTLLQALAGTLFLVTAVTTVIQLRDDSARTRREFDQAAQVQLSNRFASALSLLANKDPTVQVGAIYALRSIADDGPYYQAPIIDIMSAYVRQHSIVAKGVANRLIEANTCKLKPADFATPRSHALTPVMRQRNPVVQTILDVLGEWDENQKGGVTIDLDSTDLRAAELYNSHLESAQLFRAQLQRSRLDGALLQNATLIGSNLGGASLSNAQLRGSSLMGADLGPADEARGTFDYLKGANLTGAHLEGADLTNADLSGADLTNISIDDKTKFDGAQYDSCTRLPSSFDPVGRRMVKIGKVR